MIRRTFGLVSATLVASVLASAPTSASPTRASLLPPPIDYPAPTGLPAPGVITPTPATEATARLGPRDRPVVPDAPRLADAYRFLSAPDFLNQDVADLAARGAKRFRDPRTGRLANSTNREYDVALDHVISEMADQDATDLLVAGDLVEGRWGRDDSRAGVFGPVRTQRQRMAAAERAARVYYPAWRQRLDNHGLRTFPAVGDHEIGDDPWRRKDDAWIDFKRRHVPQLKAAYAREMLTTGGGEHRFSNRPPKGPARDTAYAVQLDPHVLLITLDVFERRGGDVHISVDPDQLEWLGKVLRQARRADVPWVMVQGHTPMTGDVRYRNSSHLSYERGLRSTLWKTMVDGGVDVYLSGEVHDQTTHVTDGVLQLSHGSLFYRGEASYVVGQATADRLVLENRQFRGTVGFSDRLWTTSRQGAPGHISYPDPSFVTGTLQALRRKSGGITLESATGVLAPRR